MVEEENCLQAGCKGKATVCLDCVDRNMMKARGTLFHQLQNIILREAFVYLDTYGGEDLQLDDVNRWFDEAKVEVLNKDAKCVEDVE